MFSAIAGLEVISAQPPLLPNVPRMTNTNQAIPGSGFSGVIPTGPRIPVIPGPNTGNGMFPDANQMARGGPQMAPQQPNINPGMAGAVACTQMGRDTVTQCFQVT